MNEIKMNFNEFKKVCRFAQPSIKDNSKFELICQHKYNSKFWVKCNEKICPFFGIKIVKGIMSDTKTGKVIMTFGPGTVIQVEELE